MKTGFSIRVNTRLFNKDAMAPMAQRADPIAAAHLRHPTAWHRLWRLGLACVFFCAACPIWADTALPKSAATTVPTASFELLVQSSSPSIAAFLEQHLDLQRYRTLIDLDDQELARLVSDADVQARQLLSTQGHFNPVLNWTTRPAGQDTSLRAVHLQVDSGPQARVANVQWLWQGDLADQPATHAQRQDIVAQWLLPAGAHFTQDAWRLAKTQALRQMVAHTYPWARLADSEALIDAPNNRVNLTLTLDSGPPVSLGPMKIVGVEKYGTLQVQRLGRLSEGQIYRYSDILDAQQRLVASGFYDSVFVSIDPNGPATGAPVLVELKETARQKWVFGVGVRSEGSLRLSAEHTHHRIPLLEWRALSRITMDKDLQSVGLDLLGPPDEDLWRWNTQTKIENENWDGYAVQSQRWRAGRTQQSQNFDRSHFAQYEVARKTGPLLGFNESFGAYWTWTWRNFDNLPHPNQGMGLAAELGPGVTLSTQNVPYVRWLIKGLGFLPLSKTTGRLSMRAELGGVASRQSDDLPATQLFLAGGDLSVRGYAPKSIGIALPNGLVKAGSQLVTTSLEWQSPIRWRGRTTDWESAVFWDAGAVANDIRLLKPEYGYGLGARWRSPVGPIRIDLAYAQALAKLRLHLSLGFTF